MSFDGFPPFISAQLQYLLTHFPHLLKIEQVWSGSKYFPTTLDRFTLLIPYCLDYIRWDVIYNAEFPLAAPDVIFGAEDEAFCPFYVKGEEEGDPMVVKNSLSDWNNKDSTRLLTLIAELRDKYILYQRKRVERVNDERLKFEISTILSREGIEMYLSSAVEKPEEVKFAVPLLDMNINKTVQACPWRHAQKIYLQVVFPVGRKYGSAPSAPRLKLVSTSELKVIFSVEDFKLPSWLDGMCMAEYLPHIEELLQRQVLEAVALIDVRRRFIEALSQSFGRPLEADPVFCRKASFLVSSGTFIYLAVRLGAQFSNAPGSLVPPLARHVHFLLSTQFPRQQPSLMLQSTQHFNSHGTPVKSPLLTEYPWSPRWETSLMAERIFDFLVEEALNFKRYCNDSQLHQ